MAKVLYIINSLNLSHLFKLIEKSFSALILPFIKINHNIYINGNINALKLFSISFSALILPFI